LELIKIRFKVITTYSTKLVKKVNCEISKINLEGSDLEVASLVESVWGSEEGHLPFVEVIIVELKNKGKSNLNQKNKQTNVDEMN
jgi:hypothetical protein